MPSKIAYFRSIQFNSVGFEQPTYRRHSSFIHLKYIKSIYLILKKNHTDVYYSQMFITHKRLVSRYSENPQNVGSIKVLCGSPLCQLSCHVHVHRYSNISVSVSDHWEVNCNDPAQVCGLSHTASISPVHCCANCMFVSGLSLMWFFF